MFAAGIIHARGSCRVGDFRRLLVETKAFTLISMPSIPDLFHLAAEYHRALPERIREYLHGRGISDEVINRRFLGWNGTRITVPVFNRNGVCAFFRVAKDPDDKSDSPKMLSSRGSHVDLYGWEVLRLRPRRIIICEGEFDRLVLEANGFDAVTSTGGAGTFKDEWAEAFKEIPEVYLCFDRDEPGRKGELRVARMIPYARIVKLPSDVGDGGDITDFFVRLGESSADFERLLAEASPGPPVRLAELRASTRHSANSPREQIKRIKRAVPIARVVGAYVELRNSGNKLIGHCPFHQERTPSFTLYPETESFHCFGCGAHGDVLNFLQRVEHLSFRQALDTLERLRSDDEDRPQ
jgi:CHC2 zinc finger/Toprim-like